MSDDPDRYAILKDPTLEVEGYAPPVRRDVHYGEKTGEADGPDMRTATMAALARDKKNQENLALANSEHTHDLVRQPEGPGPHAQLKAEHSEAAAKDGERLRQWDEQRARAIGANGELDPKLLPRSLAYEKLAAEHKEVVAKRDDPPPSRDHEKQQTESKSKDAEPTDKREMTDARQAQSGKVRPMTLKEIFEFAARDAESDLRASTERSRPMGRSR